MQQLDASGNHEFAIDGSHHLVGRALSQPEERGDLLLGAGLLVRPAGIFGREEVRRV